MKIHQNLMPVAMHLDRYYDHFILMQTKALAFIFFGKTTLNLAGRGVGTLDFK